MTEQFNHLSFSFFSKIIPRANIKAHKQGISHPRHNCFLSIIILTPLFFLSIKRVCICFYCICRGARVVLCRGFHRHRRVTAHASRNPTHDSEGERKRGLGMEFHRVNYTIFAAGCVVPRGRFPWPRKVSVVRREQIRVLIKTATAFQPFNLSTSQPFNLSGAAQSAAQTAAESSNIHPSIYSKTYTEGSDPFVPYRGSVARLR